MPIIGLILLVIGFLLICTLIVLYFVWKFKKTYTRERFTFLIATLTLSLVSILFPFIFGNNSWQGIVIIQLLNKYFNLNASVYDPTISDKILGLVIFFGFIYWMKYLHKNWSGPKSLLQHESETLKKEINFADEILALFRKDSRLKIYEPEKDDKYEYLINEDIEEKTPWYIQVSEMLSLISKQYKIDPINDWYAEYSTFISEYGKNKEILGILCIYSKPTDIEIDSFYRFVSENRQGRKIFKLIIAVQNEEFEKYNIKYDDETIEFRSQKDLLESLVDFTDYINYIAHQYETKKIHEGFDYTISDVYTIPHCNKIIRQDVINKAEICIENIEEYIQDWLFNLKENKQIALLGEYGQGKSVLALRLAYQIFTKKIKADRIPIIIELRGKFPKQYTSKISLFADWASQFRIEPQSLLKLHNAGKLLIIFEGFDEMELIGDYSIRLEHFKKLWEFSSLSSKLIITGRPNFFLNNKELITLLRTNQTNETNAFCDEIHISKFNINQIEHALRKAPFDIKTDIINILNSQGLKGNFYDLMSRPSSLFLASIIWKERNLNSFKNNINSAIVIQEFLKYSYIRQDLKNIKTPLTTKERAFFMLGIAAGMVQKNEYTNQISQNDLKGIIKKLLNHFPDEISNDTSNRHLSKTLSKRFDEKYNEDTILTDIRSCGVLVRDLSTYDSFKFAHKSYLEYLISSYFVELLVNDNENIHEIQAINSIQSAINFQKTEIKQTIDVFKFSAQLLAFKFRKRSVDQEKVMCQLFKILYPTKFLSIHSAFKLMQFFGRSPLKMFIMLLSFLGLLTIVFYTIIKLPSKKEVDPLLSKQYFYLIMVFYTLFVIWFFKRFLSRKRKRLEQEYPELKEQNLSLLEVYFRTYRSLISPYISDIGNIKLWFLTCVELNIDKNIIEKYMSKSMYDKIVKEIEKINAYNIQ